MNSNRYFTRSEAVEHLKALGLPATVSMLAKMAVRGDGPPYSCVFGRAIYAAADLEAWLIKKLGKPFASTAERTLRKNAEVGK